MNLFDPDFDMDILLSEITPEIMEYLFPGMEAGNIRSAVPVMPRLEYSGSPRHSKDIYRRRADKGRKSRRGILSRIPFLGYDKEAEVGALPPCLSEAAPALQEEDEGLDPKTAAILSEIKRIQEEFCITIEELEIILNYRVKLSRLLITRQNRIFMTDFGNREVKMDHLSKAVFFLYLRHPECIRFKSLPDYREELLGIYMRITGRDDMDEIRKSIDDIADPLGNAINVKVSRVKSAFKSAVSDRIARYYYIGGQAGEAKKILIDRDLVIWEH